MRLSGCAVVSRALMRGARGPPPVQVEPCARGGSVSALKGTGDPTATGPFALRTAESQKGEELVTQ